MKPDIASESPFRGLPVGILPKTKVVWLPEGKKIEDMSIRFDRIHERDGRTDEKTPCDGIGRVSASCGKIKKKSLEKCIEWVMGVL